MKIILALIAICVIPSVVNSQALNSRGLNLQKLQNTHDLWMSHEPVLKKIYRDISYSRNAAWNSVRL